MLAYVEVGGKVLADGVDEFKVRKSCVCWENLTTTLKFNLLLLLHPQIKNSPESLRILSNVLFFFQFHHFAITSSKSEVITLLCVSRYRVSIRGLVEKPLELSMADIR